MVCAGYSVNNFCMAGAARLGEIVRVGGERDISLMGAFFIGCLVVAFMTAHTGDLMIGVGMYGMTVNTLLDRNGFLLFSRSAT